MPIKTGKGFLYTTGGSFICRVTNLDEANKNG